MTTKKILKIFFIMTMASSLGCYGASSKQLSITIIECEEGDDSSRHKIIAKIDQQKFSETGLSKEKFIESVLSLIIENKLDAIASAIASIVPNESKTNSTTGSSKKRNKEQNIVLKSDVLIQFIQCGKDADTDEIKLNQIMNLEPVSDGLEADKIIRN